MNGSKNDATFTQWNTMQQKERRSSFVNYVPVKGEIICYLSLKSTKEKSQQNITRDIEIKNIVTIATGEWGRDSGERSL